MAEVSYLYLTSSVESKIDERYSEADTSKVKRLVLPSLIFNGSII